MKNFFLSLKTTVWILLVLIGLFFIGAYMMPAYRHVFGPMNNLILFEWIAKIGMRSLWQTWWFFAALAALVLLTVNTIVCSIQAIRGRWTRRDVLLRIAPQIVHAGFLFILLAHFLGAGWGYRLSGVMPEGAITPLPDNQQLHLAKIRSVVNEGGYLTDWSADVILYEGNSYAIAGTLGPNKPVFYRGVGIYLKSIQNRRGPAALLMVNKDPGAVWALVGGILFTLGCVMLLVFKWKKSYYSEQKTRYATEVTEDTEEG